MALTNQEKDELRSITREAFSSIGDNIKNALENALDPATTLGGVLEKDILKSLRQSAQFSEKIANNEERLKLGVLKNKDIQSQMLALRSKEKAMLDIKNALLGKGVNINSSLIQQIDESNQYYEIQRELLQDQTKELERQEKSLGLTGKLIQGISKIPVLGNLINAEKVLGDVQIAAAKEGSTRLSVMGDGFKSLGKSAVEGLTDPLTLMTAIFNAANKADQQTTALAKSLMQTKGEATATREQFVEMANASGDAFINTDKLLEANAALGKQLGFNKVFSQDLDQTFVDLTKKINLSEEAAGGLARISIVNGKTLKSTEQIIAATTSRISAQNGIQLDGKDILEESGKISGQLLANFKGNPAAIAEAVAQSKVLGTTLEQTKNQADKLLDFESSISNQLKAEVLTGKQLNLERARAAALQGDQVTVAKELASQGASFSEFTRMNVIQQRSLAEALGLSADQLSDQLLKQEAIGRSREEIVALGGEEAAQRLESLAAQDKFNAAVEKMKDLVGNLVAGPFGQLLDLVADIAGIILKILAPFVSIIGAVIKPITGVLSGALDPLNTSLANAGFSSTGATAGSSNEDVVGALNDVKSAIVAGNNKQFGVNLDGRAVGTGVVRATYRSA
jgi:hypothetical protein